MRVRPPPPYTHCAPTRRARRCSSAASRCLRRSLRMAAHQRAQRFARAASTPRLRRCATAGTACVQSASLSAPVHSAPSSTPRLDPNRDPLLTLSRSPLQLPALEVLQCLADLGRRCSTLGLGLGLGLGCAARTHHTHARIRHAVSRCVMPNTQCPVPTVQRPNPQRPMRAPGCLRPVPQP